MNRCLDLDVGNSRTKWRIGSDRGSTNAGKLPTLMQGVDRVRVSSVVRKHGEIENAIRQTFGVKPEFALSTPALAGVTNGYKDYSKLGVDRWLAIVAAWNLMHQAVIVVDVGTALTVDLTNDQGQHLGGYIVPGLETMRKSLDVSTDNVRVAPFGSNDHELSFGLDTHSAVQHGLLSMAISWIDRCVSIAEATCGNRPFLFVTGGEAEILSPHLEHSHRLEPDLVLDGLALALP